MITEYLLELLDELRLPPRRRRRILAEVEDHLTCAVAELHADGLAVADAESEAARRFGPADQLARAFVELEAARGGKRAARASALLAALLAVLVLGPPDLVLRSRAFPAGAVAFVLAQVALVAGGLTLVRAWRSYPAGGPRGARLLLVLRGGVIVLGCAATIGIYAIADALATSAWLDWTLTAWLGLAGLAIGGAATAATLARSWRGASAAGMTSIAGSPEDAEAFTDLQAVGARTLAVLHIRAPRIRAWIDLRRHPWRFAVSVATTAGVALAGGHALAEGVSANHLPGALLAAALLATVEALTALLGFGVLGRFLGIRPPRGIRLPAPETDVSTPARRRRASA